MSEKLAAQFNKQKEQMKIFTRALALLAFLPLTLIVALLAWTISGDLTRSLAVLVAATPCLLILAAPVAFIAGVAQAARRGILVKGGGALEALGRTDTVLFDKTGTLTVEIGRAHV